MERCAFVGLGTMGYPMAGHLVGAGHEVTVYNRTAETAERWVDEYGGVAVPTPGSAAAGAAFVFVCVGDDDDLRSVVGGGDGVLAAMSAGTVLVDHTTASATVARELHAEASARGVGFIDAPVSGGEAGAINGQLTVMCGGDAAVFGSTEPLMRAYGKAVTHIGPPGAGQLTKMVNQICIAGLIQGLSEGLEFGRRAGLDLDLVVDVISQGAAGSWQMENRAKTMWRGEFDFGFALDWMRKDLDICLTQGDELGAPLEVTALVKRFYDELSSEGMGRSDSSALIQRLSGA